MLSMYPKQKEIYDNILLHYDKNCIIINSNGVGVSILLKNIFDTLVKLTDRKIYVYGLHKNIREIFKNEPCEIIEDYNYEDKLDNNSTIISFDYFDDKIFKYAKKVGCNIIGNLNACLCIDLSEYDYTYFINAFDTPNFEGISLDDIVNNTYKDKVKENFWTRYLISPDDARNIYENCGKNINNFEFKTRILGK